MPPTAMEVETCAKSASAPRNTAWKRAAALLLGCAALAAVGGQRLVVPDATKEVGSSLRLGAKGTRSRPQVGGSKDANGCLGSAGFTLCPTSGECVRAWMQSCPGGTPYCQELCAVEPADSAELSACRGDHKTWLSATAKKPFTGLLGVAHRGCAAYASDGAGCRPTPTQTACWHRMHAHSAYV